MAERRLAVYLLLDISGSMTGDPIVAVNEGVQLLYRELVSDPQALETVHISIITFSSQADQYSLTALDQFQPPSFSAGGSTAMGDAFGLLADLIQQDLLLNTETQHGDYRPLVFLLTDGAPTDEYRSKLNWIKSLRGSRKPTIVALGCGSGVDVNMLHEVTENVFLMQNLNPVTLRQFFLWISGSVTQTSHAVAGGGGNATLPPPTNIPGITYNPS